MSNPSRSRLFSFLLLLVMSPAMAAAVAGTPAKLMADVQQRYGQLHSLEFDFTQITVTSGRTREGRGHAVFYRPTSAGKRNNAGVIRWNYTEPTEQTIINDGRELSIYTPRDKQLLVSPASEMETDVTYSLFTGARGIQDAFEAAPPDAQFLLSPALAETTALLLTPRQPQSQVRRVQLWLGPDHALRRLLMEDHFGALTELTFSNIRINGLRPHDPAQTEALRHLELAPDTETIHQ